MIPDKFRNSIDSLLPWEEGNHLLLFQLIMIFLSITIYTDWCHPNYKGTATIVKEIKMALGINTGPYYHYHQNSGAQWCQNSGNASSNDQTLQ